MKGKPIGWAAGIVEYDSMSCAHLILDREGIAVPACGSRGRISGQLHKTPPDYARGTCRTCQRIAKARGEGGAA